MSCSSCSDSAPIPVIYACSGAADVGEIADRAARRLSGLGLGKMSCAAGVGAGIPSLRNGAFSAGRVLAIDGCATRCVAKAMAESRVAEFVHVELGSEGFAKGRSPATEENVARAVEVLRCRLGAS